MASTRRLEIFQDPMPSANAEMPAPSVYSLAVPPRLGRPSPAHRLSSNGVILHPPGVAPMGRSPLKSAHQQNKSPPKGLDYNGTPNVSFPPPQPAAFTTDSPTKRLINSKFQATASPSAPKFVTPAFPVSGSADKENFNPSFHSDNFAEFPDPNCDSKASPKRKLLDAAPIHDRQSKKPKLAPRLEPKLDTKPTPNFAKAAPRQIPEPKDMPLLDDNGSKPPYSYASLIGMSILRAPNRRLTLAQIYKWISDSFSYYHASDARWQNSIRHNLSLNKAFIKHERPKDDPGKGNYWAIEPGMEMQFVKDKPSRRPTSSSGPSMRIFTQSSSEANPSTWPRDSTSAAKAEVRVSAGCEPSSDATIPASDAVSHKDDILEPSIMPQPSSNFPLSSPLELIHSSPPVSHRLQNNDDLSPLARDFTLPSSRPSSGKRKLAAMDDSGYFSSINSSVPRPCHTGNVSTSEIGGDKKRIRRGRAEEEIARIRSSPHDISPSKCRTSLKQPLQPLVSSSPLRNFDNSTLFPPLTPAVKLKVPPKPPASVSPNTNLRNHRNKIRDLVGSPAKTASLVYDEIPFSPAFTIAQDESFPTLPDEWDFDILVNSEVRYMWPSVTSPKQPSAGRHRFDRASKTGTILADVTGSGLNSKASASALSAPIWESPTGQKSGKVPILLNDHPINRKQEDIFGLDLSVDDEETDDFGGLDLLQGFQKIGGNSNLHSSPSKVPRTLMGARSHTSRF